MNTLREALVDTLEALRRYKNALNNAPSEFLPTNELYKAAQFASEIMESEAIKKWEDSSGKETGMNKEYFIQLFRDNFNCYADTGNSGTSVPAMTEDQMLKTFFQKFQSVPPYKEHK